MRNRWTKEERNILSLNYGKIKIDRLQEIIKTHSIQAIQKEAQRMRLKGNQSVAQRIYNFDENYFDKPNINNSYWAGFIAADGNLGKDGVISISIAEKDISILNAFKKAINSEHPIKITTVDNKKYATIHIWGAYSWYKNLYKYWNITPNKTLTLLPPNIKNINKINAYIIGYFDGDGSCWVCKNGYLNWSVCGNINIITWIRLILSYKLPNLNWNDKIQLNGISKVNYKITYTCNKARNIVNYLKKLPLEFRLERKWVN